MRKTVLVAGGTGFIGYHLIKKLKRNFRVISLSSKKPVRKRRVENIRYIKCDIFKKKSLKEKLKRENIDYVVNLAGYVDHSNKKKTMQTHYNGCKNLVDYFKNKDIKLFLQIGSSLEYGNQKSPHSEKQKCNPIAVYGKSKLKSTKYILKIAKKVKFNLIVLRLYQIYGPNQSINRLIPIVINSCLKNQKFNCSTGLQKRDFLYIEDLVNLLNKIICSKKKVNGIFNVGSCAPIKVKDLINLINNKIKKGYPQYGQIVMRKDEQMEYFPNTKKISKFFSWKPKMSIKLGLNKTINSYKKELS